VQDGAAGGEGVAVLPTGVATMRPSQTKEATGWRSTSTSINGGAGGGAPAHDDVVEGAGAHDLAAAGAADEAGVEERMAATS
jgi:hypothetical protein